MGIPYGATCHLRVNVRTARVALFGNELGDTLGMSTPVVGVECLSTTYQDEMLQIQNEGDDPVQIFSLGLDQSWLSATSIVDSDGVAVELPALVAARSAFWVTLRCHGTSVPPGIHIANGTVVSSIS